MSSGDTLEFEHHRGYFVCWRTEIFEEVLRLYPDAFRLLALIASRARWRDGMSVDGLCQNQCFLGESDVWRALKMSPRSYRTAKKVLSRLGQVTFKTTNRGTIATLTETSVLAASAPRSDKPTDRPKGRQRTGRRQTSDGPPTTNKNSKIETTKDEKKGKTGNALAPHSLTPTEMIRQEKSYPLLKNTFEEHQTCLINLIANKSGEDQIAPFTAKCQHLLDRLNEIETLFDWPLTEAYWT